MWSHWRCYDCGYQGAIILEDEEIAEEVKKEYLRKCSEEEE